MKLNAQLPINQVSFGQVSTCLLREFFKKEIDLSLFPIGNPDLSCFDLESNFSEWLKFSIENNSLSFSRKDKTFKLWHLNGALESVGDNISLFSFYELDSPTKTEINIVSNINKVFFSNSESVDIFKSNNCNNVHYIPLGFDSLSFKRIDKRYHNDDRIVFNLCGKLEKRKHHEKVLKSWIKKYGNNPKYHLQCAIYNPFLDEKTNLQTVARILDDQKYYNVTFFSHMQKNNLYNDFLNSADIIIGMSGGEGWGLPEFHSVALGKHSVILNAHAYKDWANKDNSTLIEPLKQKISAEDGIFFRKNAYYSQGNIYDFNPDDFIDGCEIAISKVEKNKLNKSGLELQNKFTYEKTLNKILELI